MRTRRVIWFLAFSLVALGAVFVWQNAASSRQKERVTGQVTTTDGRIFAFELQLPAGWANKVAVRAEENVVFVDHVVPEPVAAQVPEVNLFTIAALTPAEWDEVQQWPHYGEILQRLDGVVFYYSHPLDNPYSAIDEEAYRQLAEAYHSMFDQGREVAASFQVSRHE